MIAARKVSRQERLAIEAEAEERGRKKLLAEQQERFDALGEAGDIDQGTLTKVIKAAYGL